MKEISDIPKPTETPPIRRRIYPISKRFKQIKPTSHPNNYYLTVQAKINSYLRVLQIVKNNYLKQGENYFERNQINDNSDPLTIYTFLSDQIYWYIECDMLFNINIHYEFNNCPYEQEITSLITSNLLMPVSTRKTIDLQKFLKGVIAYQDPKYIHQQT